ncbi:hypothetical protein AWC11_07620 [Mycobacterium interjectum]|nr:hypothetical protein AWC11_07620 [Mycobacterium interjectum]
MKRLLAVAALVAGISAAVLGAGPAQADPAMCQFLGSNYDVQYDCLAPQPWLPYGTGNNPPLGGSAVTPGGDGPTVNGREPGWSGPNCPACSS